MQLFGYIPQPKPVFNPALMNSRIGVQLPVKSGVPDMPSKGMLKITGFIHNRLTICAYQGGSRRVGKRLRASDIGARCSAVPNIYLLRKTRRMLKVGGRWRELPLRTAFTSRAKNMLKDAGQLIEGNCQGVGLFLTLTMAGGTENAFEAMGIASGYVVDRFNRWLRYKVDQGFFGYVWELQERGAPHLHYLFRMPSGTDFVHFYKATRQEWRQILLDVSEETGVDLFEQVGGGTHRDNPNLPGINFQVMSRGFAGYLAKYATKERTKAGGLSTFVPGRHWGVSYPIRKEVLMRRVSFVLGSTSLERATERLIEVVDRLACIVKTIWRPESEKCMAGDFVSVTLGNYSPGFIANVIRSWLVDGDLSDFEKLESILPMVRAAPA